MPSPEDEQKSGNLHRKPSPPWPLQKQVSDLASEFHFLSTVDPFNPQGKYMLSHARRMIEFQEDNGTAIVGVHPQFEDLINSMRSAYAIEDDLKKDRGAFADSFDSLLMNLSWYKWSK